MTLSFTVKFQERYRDPKERTGYVTKCEFSEKDIKPAGSDTDTENTDTGDQWPQDSIIGMFHAEARNNPDIRVNLIEILNR